MTYEIKIQDLTEEEYDSLIRYVEQNIPDATYSGGSQ